MQFRVAGTGFAIALLSACSNLLGLHDPELIDGGAMMPDAPPNTVIGRDYRHCMTIDGKSADVPTDLSTTTVAALVPESGDPTGYRTVAGAGKADGTFRIDSVADGMEYLLRLGDHYYVTSQHSIDVHDSVPQRCTPPPAAVTTSATLHLAVANMTPFINGPEHVVDRIEVQSFNLAYRGGRYDTLDTSTALAVDYAWGSDGTALFPGPTPLLDAAAGDDLLVAHFRLDSLPGNSGRSHGFAHVIDVFEPTGVTLRNGATSDAVGSFTAAGAGRTQQVGVARGEFEAGFDGNSEFLGINVEVFAHPIANSSIGFGALIASVDFGDWSRSTSAFEIISFPYSDPFPSSWARLVEVHQQRQRDLILPGQPSGSGVGFTAYTRRAIYDGAALDTTPTLPPPGNIKVGGADFGLGGLVHFDGTAPVTVSWNGVAAAKVTTLNLYRVTATSGITLLAAVSTAGTSVRIPANLFTGGEYFAFELTEVRSPADYAAGALTPNGVPFELASTWSGVFRLNATCGDGRVDPGEDCDTVGESPTCNADCTRPRCGDTHRNSAAGEACDTGPLDTATCDSDCTLPVCGDGHVNRSLEDCDDGNVFDDGNGCSSQCKFNNVCGNSRTESIVEQCDAGGVDTAGCDADCTLPRCGDGHLNRAAGEECDDGNTSDNDHCSSQCKIK